MVFQAVNQESDSNYTPTSTKFLRQPKQLQKWSAHEISTDGTHLRLSSSYVNRCWNFSFKWTNHINLNLNLGALGLELAWNPQTGHS